MTATIVPTTSRGVRDPGLADCRVRAGIDPERHGDRLDGRSPARCDAHSRAPSLRKRL